MGNKYKYRTLGALLECLIEFPLFGDDYYCLEANGEWFCQADII